MRTHTASGIRRLAGLTLAAALLAGCTGPTEVTPALLEGAWGGLHAAVTFAGDGSATVEYDCAHGAITAPLAPGAAGSFSAGGTHVPEHGGPVQEGEVLPVHPARYDGVVRGDRLRYTVTLLDSGSVLGPFDLRRGEPGQLFRCL